MLLLICWNPLGAQARLIDSPPCEVFLSEPQNTTRLELERAIDGLIKIAISHSQQHHDIDALLKHIAQNGFSGLKELSLGSAGGELRNIFLKISHVNEHSWISEYTQNSLSEKLKIQSTQNVQQNRLLELHESLVTVQEMEFVQVPGRNYMKTEQDGLTQKKVFITHDIEVLTTKVTQDMWKKVMGFNPSHFKYQPHHPVESITWWSAAVFANKVSEQAKLRPVWDFSKIDFRGSAAEGTLEALDTQIALTQILIDSGGGDYLPEQDSDIEQSEGYRLGSYEEKEFLLRDRGRTRSEFPFGIKISDLPKYAWGASNSGRGTRRVGSTALFFQIQGSSQPLYDLIGNVWEWGDDFIGSRWDLRDGGRAVMGGSWRSLNETDFKVASRRFMHPGSLMRDNGLRLLRSIH